MTKLLPQPVMRSSQLSGSTHRHEYHFSSASRTSTSSTVSTSGQCHELSAPYHRPHRHIMITQLRILHRAFLHADLSLEDLVLLCRAQAAISYTRSNVPGPAAPGLLQFAVPWVAAGRRGGSVLLISLSGCKGGSDPLLEDSACHAYIRCITHSDSVSTDMCLCSTHFGNARAILNLSVWVGPKYRRVCVITLPG